MLGIRKVFVWSTEPVEQLLNASGNYVGEVPLGKYGSGICVGSLCRPLPSLGCKCVREDREEVAPVTLEAVPLHDRQRTRWAPDACWFRKQREVEQIAQQSVLNCRRTHSSLAVHSAQDSRQLRP